MWVNVCVMYCLVDKVPYDTGPKTPTDFATIYMPHTVDSTCPNQDGAYNRKLKIQ